MQVRMYAIQLKAVCEKVFDVMVMKFLSRPLAGAHLLSYNWFCPQMSVCLCVCVHPQGY